MSVGPDGERERFRSPRNAEATGTNSDPLSLFACLGIREKPSKGLVLTRASAVGAGHQLLSLARLPVGVLVAQAEVAVVVGDDGAVGSLLSCRRQEIHVRKRAFSHLSDGSLRVSRLWLSEGRGGDGAASGSFSSSPSSSAR